MPKIFFARQPSFFLFFFSIKKKKRSNKRHKQSEKSVPVPFRARCWWTIQGEGAEHQADAPKDTRTEITPLSRIQVHGRRRRKKKGKAQYGKRAGSGASGAGSGAYQKLCTDERIPSSFFL